MHVAMAHYASASVPRVAADARRLILVRHGAVDRAGSDPPVRPSAFYGGNVDVPLSTLGKAEALAAAKLIATEHRDEVSAIWSSPMRRALFGARATGTAIANAAEGAWTSPMDVTTFEAFREIDRGPVGTGWTDMTADEVEARDGPGALERCATQKELGAWRAVNGGEGFCDVRKRVLDQRDALLATLPAGRAGVIVSHLWVTRSMLGEALGIDNPLEVDVPTASVSVVDYPEGFSAKGLADGTCARPVVQAAGHKPPLE